MIRKNDIKCEQLLDCCCVCSLRCANKIFQFDLLHATRFEIVHCYKFDSVYFSFVINTYSMFVYFYFCNHRPSHKLNVNFISKNKCTEFYNEWSFNNRLVAEWSTGWIVLMRIFDIDPIYCIEQNEHYIHFQKKNKFLSLDQMFERWKVFVKRLKWIGVLLPENIAAAQVFRTAKTGTSEILNSVAIPNVF